MGELGALEIVRSLTRMLAIVAGISSGLAFVSVLWLCLSEPPHKKTGG